MAFGGRVHAIRQVELAHAADPFENKWDQRRLVFFCQRGINRDELCALLAAQVRWHLHARDDNLCARIFCFCSIHDGLKVFPRGFDR